MADFEQAIGLYWLTGFFEGEGSCGCYHSGRGRHRLSASIAQKDRAILDEIRELLGFGSVTQNRYSYGVCFHWRCESADARRFLKMLQPYLRTAHKKQQVSAALAKDAEHVGPRHTRRDPLTGRLIKRVAA